MGGDLSPLTLCHPFFFFFFDNVDSSPCHITVTEERVWGKCVWWYHGRGRNVAWCLMVLPAYSAARSQWDPPLPLGLWWEILISTNFLFLYFWVLAKQTPHFLIITTVETVTLVWSHQVHINSAHTHIFTWKWMLAHTKQGSTSHWKKKCGPRRLWKLVAFYKHWPPGKHLKSEAGFMDCREGTLAFTLLASEHRLL